MKTGKGARFASFFFLPKIGNFPCYVSFSAKFILERKECDEGVSLMHNIIDRNNIHFTRQGMML